MGDPVIKLIDDISQMLKEMLSECDFCYLCDSHSYECKCVDRVRDVKAWYKKKTAKS